MPTYNSLISRSDSSPLVNEQVIGEILSNVAASNPVLSLGRRLPDMPTSQTRMPVLSSLATAYFVTGDTGLKQTTEVNWANKYIDAEEVAAIVPIPEAVLNDASYDIWSQVRPEIVNAINYAINRAVLFGTNIPSSWTTDMGAAGLLAGIVAASQTVDFSTQTSAGDDIYDMIFGASGTLSLIEQDGFMATGHIGALSMLGKLRGVREKVYNGSSTVGGGMPIFGQTLLGTSVTGGATLMGQPIFFPTDGSMDAATALLFSGQWNQLVWAMRQDMTFKVLDQAVIQDGSGNIIYNLAQQDMVALRCVMRLGVALPNPINRVNTSSSTRFPFAALVP